jgi:hypothetical protein
MNFTCLLSPNIAQSADTLNKKMPPTIVPSLTDLSRSLCVCVRERERESERERACPTHTHAHTLNAKMKGKAQI